MKKKIAIAKVLSKENFCLKGVLAVLIFGIANSSAFAQISKLTNALKSETTSLKSLFDVGVNIMYAVGAIAGLIGAIILYQKWNAGEPQTGKLVGGFFGSCAFLVIVATVLKTVFLS